MYFYNSLILIINILILTIQIQSQKPNGFGISACGFYGSSTVRCGESNFKITDIPEECTSIVFFGAYVDLRYHVYADACTCEDNARILSMLDELLKSGKPIYLYYGHYDEAEWSQVLACEEINGGVNSKDEMIGLKAFLEEHPGITGLVLMGLESDPSFSIPFPKFSENFKKYLEVMRTTFPELEIGIDYMGVPLIQQISNPDLPKLDFKILESAFDFIIVSALYLNDCSADLIDTGISPMRSSTTNVTLETLKSIVPQIGIPKEKTYYGFRLDPMSYKNDEYGICDLTIQAICLDKEKTCIWCSDNQTTLNEKGQFAKENGIGFVAYYINFNDPTNLCKCEKPFASFYALLDGFNGVKSTACALFSRV